jgi:hypothetical protein
MTPFTKTLLLLTIALEIENGVALPPIIQDFIPRANSNRPGTIITATFITVHNTANPGCWSQCRRSCEIRQAAFTEGQLALHSRRPLHLPTLTHQRGRMARWLNCWKHQIHVGIEICENSDGEVSKCWAERSRTNSQAYDRSPDPNFQSGPSSALVWKILLASHSTEMAGIH